MKSNTPLKNRRVSNEPWILLVLFQGYLAVSAASRPRARVGAGAKTPGLVSMVQLWDSVERPGHRNSVKKQIQQSPVFRDGVLCGLVWFLNDLALLLLGICFVLNPHFSVLFSSVLRALVRRACWLPRLSLSTAASAVNTRARRCGARRWGGGCGARRWAPA